MSGVRIARVGTAFPPYRVKQEEAARRIGIASGEPRRVMALARGSRIEERALVVPVEDVGRLGSIEARNDVYKQHAPALAIEAARRATEGFDVGRIGLVVCVSCTGYMVPGWDVHVVQELGLSPETARLPITQAGCAGGVVGLARARDYLHSHPDRSALVVAAELCSLAFHPDTDPGNLTAALIFGDGAAAAVLEGDAASKEGIEVVDALSSLVPRTRGDIGFELSDAGLLPVLSRELAELLPAPTREAVAGLLARHGLTTRDAGFWLVHAGGAAILSALERGFCLPCDALRWSWESLAGRGNLSSASVLDVASRYLDDVAAPRGWGIVLAFGPGVSIEALLVHRC